MIDDRAVQRELAQMRAYQGAIDGIFGAGSRRAVRAALALAGVDSTGWTEARARIAIEQLIMARAGIEAGAIDGLVGPQTRFAWELWQNRLRDVTPSVGEVAHQPTRWPRQKDARDFFGAPGEQQRLLAPPYAMRLAWEAERPISLFSLHEKVHASAERALEKAVAHYGASRLRALGLDLFGGCLNIRKMRGGSSLSMHSWGIAIDFDPARNQLRWGKDRARMARPEYAAFLDIWEAEGWISLGRERNYDWMHIQAARL